MTSHPEDEDLYRRRLSGEKLTNLPPALVPPRTTLAGRWVTLEPQDAARHAEELYAAGHEGEQAMHIWDYLGYGPWPDIEAYRANLRQQSANFEVIFFAIRDHASGKACGQAAFLEIDPACGAIEIGHIWFSPALQRTRAATEALFLMLCHAMDDLGNRRMVWKCNALNARSRNAAHRLGFRFEGIFHNHIIFKGRNRDTAWYSILDDEWPQVRERIAAWLADDNFAEDGTPLSSLRDAMDARPPHERQIG